MSGGFQAFSRSYSNLYVGWIFGCWMGREEASNQDLRACGDTV